MTTPPRPATPVASDGESSSIQLQQKQQLQQRRALATNSLSRVSPAAPRLNGVLEWRTIEPPRHAISRILADGDIPILRIEVNDTDKLSLRARRASGSLIKYVVVVHRSPESDAHSHPINDAIGIGPITTSQLVRLADRMGKLQVEEIRAELCFWTESLCVLGRAAADDAPTPVPVPRIEEIYRNAYAVLIFDHRHPQHHRCHLHRRRSSSSSRQRMRDASEGGDECVAAAQSYLSSLMCEHPNLSLNPRLIVITPRGCIDMRANGPAPNDDDDNHQSQHQSDRRHAILIPNDYVAKFY